MDKVHRLPILRPLGKSEQLSAVSHELEFFKNVGISAHYTLSESAASLNLRQAIYAAVTEVIRRNDILSAIPVDEASPDAYFARLPSIDLTRCVFFKSRTSSIEQGEQDPELDAILQDEHNTDFKSNYGALPFWRLIILQGTGPQLSFTTSFIFHHSLGDGATGMIFHQSFRQALDTALTLPSSLEQSSSPMIQTPTNTTLLPPLEALHPLPLNPNPPNHQAVGLQEWTGNFIRLPLHSHYKTLYLSPPSSAAFAEKCKENGVSVTAGLTAVLASAIFPALPHTFDALTGIIPINLRPWLTLPAGANSAAHAMGSFIDAIKVQIQRSQYEIDSGEKNTGWMGRLPAAKHTAEEIKRYLTANSSPSGEPYTSVAAFKGIQDVPAVFNGMVGRDRDAAFEISNLGRFSLGTAGGGESDRGGLSASSGDQWSVGRMGFSRSAVGFGAALTTSVVSGADGGLTMGFSWQEGVVEDSFAEVVIKTFREHFESP